MNYPIVFILVIALCCLCSGILRSVKDRTPSNKQIEQWSRNLGRNRPITLRSGMVADDAFPLHYRSPYIPPRVPSAIYTTDDLERTTLSDEGQAFINSLTLMSTAGKITLYAPHQECILYTPPTMSMPYAVSVEDAHEPVMREEAAESGKVRHALPISLYTGQPYDPEWGTPHPRFDSRLKSTEFH